MLNGQNVVSSNVLRRTEHFHRQLVARSYTWRHFGGVTNHRALDLGEVDPLPGDDGRQLVAGMVTGVDSRKWPKLEIHWLDRGQIDYRNWLVHVPIIQKFDLLISLLMRDLLHADRLLFVPFR